MRMPENLGFILLGIWLILEGLALLFGLSFEGMSIILGLLALIAGLILLLDHLAVRARRRR